MARTKQTARKSVPPVITWTRFHLPLGQKWPTWAGYPEPDQHYGPLTNVPGVNGASLGRIVQDPEQAAYVITWHQMEDFKDFLSTPACTEFLQNLPEHGISQSSVESGSALESLTLEDNASSTLLPTQSRRFFALEHFEGRPTHRLKGRMTFTAFSVPGSPPDYTTKRQWYKDIREALDYGVNRWDEYHSRHSLFQWFPSNVWFWVDGEDSWMENKFGKLEQQTGEGPQGRTIICEFRVWPGHTDCMALPEQKEGPLLEPKPRELWERAVSTVMPPVAAWEQERWDVRPVPRVYPDEEMDDEDD